MAEPFDGDAHSSALWAVVHELTEPLTALTGYVEAARRQLATDAAPGSDGLAELLDRASAQTRRAADALLRLRQLLPEDPQAAKPET